MRPPTAIAPAIAVAIAMVLTLATPAGADGPHPFEVTGGVLETALSDFPLTTEVSGEPPCAEKPVTHAVTFDPGGTWDAAGTSTNYYEFPADSDNWYQADFELLVGSGGTWSGTTSPYTIDGIVAITQTVYHVGSAASPDCAKASPLCTLTGVFTITTGEFYGSLPNPSVGDYALIDGSTAATGIPLVASACAPPFSAFNGTDAYAVGMTLTLV